MKKIWFLLSFLLFTGCTSVRFATIEKGQIVDDHHRVLNILGNPHIICYKIYYDIGYVVADGYFVYQIDETSILVDEFGKDYKVVKNPVCELGQNN